jgi:GPH family glycoside/pentoside/hexuronide:cation symporter
LSLYVAGACIVLGIIPGLFCKGIDSSYIENRTEISFRMMASNLIVVLRGIAQKFKNASFVRLCGTTFLVFNGFQLVAAFSYFIVVFHMFNGDYGERAAGLRGFQRLVLLSLRFWSFPSLAGW